MRMECSPWKMIEQTKEELQILETQYPDRFGHLKLELKSFISYLESQQNNNKTYFYQYQTSICLPSPSTANTQASTSRKRKKGGSGIQYETVTESRNEEFKQKFQRVLGDFKRRDRIDLVLEKAQSCLQKIQEVKSSLC